MVRQRFTLMVRFPFARRHGATPARAALRLLTLTLALFVAATATAVASTPEAAAREAQRATGGQVLKVTPASGRPGYMVKVLLSNGTVRVIYVNP